MALSSLVAKLAGKGWRLSGHQSSVAALRKHLDPKYSMQVTQPDSEGNVVAVCSYRRRQALEAAAAIACVAIEDADAQKPKPTSEPETKARSSAAAEDTDESIRTKTKKMKKEKKKEKKEKKKETATATKMEREEEEMGGKARRDKRDKRRMARAGRDLREPKESGLSADLQDDQREGESADSRRWRLGDSKTKKVGAAIRKSLLRSASAFADREAKTSETDGVSGGGGSATDKMALASPRLFVVSHHAKLAHDAGLFPVLYGCCTWCKDAFDRCYVVYPVDSVHEKKHVRPVCIECALTFFVHPSSSWPAASAASASASSASASSASSASSDKKEAPASFETPLQPLPSIAGASERAEWESGERLPMVYKGSGKAVDECTLCCADLSRAPLHERLLHIRLRLDDQSLANVPCCVKCCKAVLAIWR